MKVIIVDDERLARNELRSLISEFPEIEIIDEATNAQEALTKISEQQPDVVFMDIHMPHTNGIEALKQLKELDEIPKVVFVTAYDEHAIEAFRLNALDYLLKPVDPTRLNETISKLLKAEEEEHYDAPHQSNRKDRPLEISDQIFIKDGEKCYFVALQDIRYFESMGNYVKVFFHTNKPMILRSLNSLEERLSPDHFFRANRKYIINLNHISAIENWFNGGLQVTLSENEKIEISRRQTIRFKEMMSI
ncbi:MAG: response regulator [Crocinitomicaceae bacterium]|nr:response regulator [Crocinitomicaceae bacterium]